MFNFIFLRLLFNKFLIFFKNYNGSSIIYFGYTSNSRDTNYYSYLNILPINLTSVINRVVFIESKFSCL